MGRAVAWALSWSFWWSCCCWAEYDACRISGVDSFQRVRLIPAENSYCATPKTVGSLSPVCPACGAHSLNRVQRRFIDHLLGMFGRVRRYRCYAFNCQWKGNLKVADDELE